MVIRPANPHKRYAPVRITNPLSDLHMVYLHANQGFTVEVSQWMLIDNMVYTSNYFKLTRHTIDSEKTQYWEFEATQDLSDWTRFSNTFLGHVTLIAKDTISTLCVVLLSENPSVITLVNPANCEIKVAPHQIIEFVFYGPQAENLIKNRSITSGDEGIIYSEKGEESIATDTDFAMAMDFPTGFVVRPRNKEFQEFHYWYSLDQITLQRIYGFANNVYKAGKLAFGRQNECAILVNLNVKRREAKKEKVKAQPSSLILPSKSKVITGNAWREPSICDVTLTLKENSSLHDGCKVIDLAEIKKHIENSNKVIYVPSHRGRTHCAID